MVEFKVEFVNDPISLVQTEESHFGDLYLVASNPIIWEQHPESDS